jgi:tetratricopeptide (TPR) repeat protein
MKRVKRAGLSEWDLPEVYAEAGSLYLEMGRFGHAQTYLERSLALWDRYSGAESLGRIRAANNLVALYTETQQLKRAQKLAEQTLEGLGLYPSEEAHALHNLGAVYYFRGRYHDAESLVRKAATVLEQNGSADDAQMMYLLVTMTPILVRTGKAHQALDCVQRARRIGEQIFGPADIVLARVLIAESAVLRVLNRIPEAMTAIQKALAMLPDAVEPLLQAAWDEYGMVLRQSGRKRDAAVAASRAAAIRRHLESASRSIVDVNALERGRSR